MNAFDRVVAEAQRWGISVVFESIGASPNDCFPAPRHRAHISSYISSPGPASPAAPVITWDDARRGSLCVNGLMHELVHAIVWQRTGLSPSLQSDLFNIALEFEAVARLRLPWTRWSRLFGVTYMSQWEEVDARERLAVMTFSRRWLSDAGLLKDGRPTYEWTYSDAISRYLTDAKKRLEKRQQMLESAIREYELAQVADLPIVLPPMSRVAP